MIIKANITAIIVVGGKITQNQHIILILKIPKINCKSFYK